MSPTIAPISVFIEDEDHSVRVDPVTRAMEIDQPDGGVVVRYGDFGAEHRDDNEKWFENLAEKMDPQELATIANDLFEAVSADDTSRQQSLVNAERGLDLLGIELKDPKSSVGDGAVEGMSSVTNPLMLEAVLKGWATAHSELLPATGPVKIRDEGDASQALDDLAESFERDLNYWFTTSATEYYPETSYMLLWGVYFIGSGIKKIYRCPMRRRPVSEQVDHKDFIVSNATKDLRSCGRITHQISMRQSVMKRMMFIGAYRDVTLTQPSPTIDAVSAKIGEIQGTTPQRTRPEDQPYTLWETQCEIDLDQFIPKGSTFKGEGIPLPYCVTMDKDSREIIAIRRDWDRNNPDCQRIRMYVKYPYVPGPGFYGTGLVNILGNASAAMTAAWREALDAGMFASFPGGLMQKIAGRQESSVFRLSPGEFKGIDTGGQPINNFVTGLPYRDVTPGLMALMDKITQQAKGVSGAPEMPVGEGLQNVPVGTMLAAVEQATKIISAAHKGMHTAMSEEIQLVVDLFRDNPEDFWRGNTVCEEGYWDEEKFEAALKAYKTRLVPVSDPNVPSHIHRVAKALALINIAQMPQFAPYLSMKEVLVRALRAIREDERGLVIDPPPQQEAQPAPGDMAKIIEANAKATDAQTKLLKLQFDGGAAARKDEVKMHELASKERLGAIDLRKEMVIHAHDGERAQRNDLVDAISRTRDDQHRLRAHVLDVAEHVRGVQMDQHQQVVDHRKLDIDEHKAKNPPKPSPTAKSKKKSK